MMIDLTSVRYANPKSAAAHKVIQLPTDADLCAWAIKNWVQRGVVPIEKVDAQVYLAACRLARRR